MLESACSKRTRLRIAETPSSPISNSLRHTRAYYWKPLTQGGGNKSFNGITIKMLYPMVENVNARYFVESAHDAECTITGVGKIVTGNGDSVCVKIKVDELRNFIIIVN